MLRSPVEEDLGHGISRRWLDDGKIAIYTTYDTGRASVDTWAGHVIADARNWDPDLPYLIVHDFKKISITPYSRRKAEEVCRAYSRDLRGRFGLVVQPGPIGLTFRLFTQRTLKRLVPPGLQEGYFGNLEDALDWLGQHPQV